MTQHSETHDKLVVDDEIKVGPVHDRVFGSFVEHLGRCVYTGIYEPGHPTADEEGFRYVECVWTTPYTSVIWR